MEKVQRVIRDIKKLASANVLGQVPVPDGGTPILSDGEGYPYPSNGGNTPSKTEWGYPSPRNEWHLDRLCCRQYASRGFPKEDFLVLFRLS